MRRAPRLDTAHKPVQEAFEQLGCSVLSLAGQGSGCPDLLVAVGGVACLVEVKTPKKGTKPETKRKQEAFRASWGGWTEIARGMDDVQRIAAQMRQIYRRTAS